MARSLRHPVRRCHERSRERVHQHKTGAGSGFTTKYKVSKLVYCEETKDIGLAIDREKQIKRWSRKKKIELVETINPRWRDLSVEHNED